MASYRILFVIALITLAACADGRKLMQGRAAGNNNSNNSDRVFATEGGRNEAAIRGTSAAIAAAVANGKAYYASSFGKQAAMATSQRSASSKAFDSTGARHLLQGGRASGNNNPNNGDRVFATEGGRNEAAIRGTSAAIAAAVANGKAYMASSFGKQAAMATSQRSASSKAFDSTGARHLLQGATNSRSDRTAMAASVTSDVIEKAVAGAASRSAMSKATSGGIKYAKLAAKQSTRPADFSP